MTHSDRLFDFTNSLLDMANSGRDYNGKFLSRKDVETLLALYDAVWNVHAARFTHFGDPYDSEKWEVASMQTMFTFDTALSNVR